MNVPDPGRTSSHVTRREAIAAETAKFVAALAGASLATPVPSCPGWTLLDLVRHTGSVQRRFSALLREGFQEPPRSREIGELRLPDHEDGYPEWLTASAAEAAETFTAVDPDAPMWAWGADQHARFWVRRMLFETLVHRTDAETAVGIRPTVDRELAADGVDEFLVNLPFAASFAPEVARLRGQDETLLFRCTDSEAGWLVRLRPDGFGVEPAHGDPAAAAASADAAVHAAAADLLLLVYGRLDRRSDAFTVHGDHDLLERWFAHSAF